MARKKPGPVPSQGVPRRGPPAPTPPENRALAALALRTIFLNVFHHNGARLNSARYEARWRFTVTLCWREGEPSPCPAAAGHENPGRTSHQLDVEFGVSVADLALSARLRVDDAGVAVEFPSVWVGGDYVGELREALGRHFGLAYPKVEDEPQG